MKRAIEKSIWIELLKWVIEKSMGHWNGLLKLVIEMGYWNGLLNKVIEIGYWNGLLKWVIEIGYWNG